MLYRLDTSLLRRFGAWLDIGERVVAKNGLKHIAGIIWNEQRNPPRSILRDRHCTLSCAFALLLKRCWARRRCNFDFDVYAIRWKCTVRKIQRFAATVCNVERSAELCDDPAAMFFADSLQGALPRGTAG